MRITWSNNSSFSVFTSRNSHHPLQLGMKAPQGSPQQRCQAPGHGPQRTQAAEQAAEAGHGSVAMNHWDSTDQKSDLICQNSAVEKMKKTIMWSKFDARFCYHNRLSMANLYHLLRDQLPHMAAACPTVSECPRRPFRSPGKCVPSCHLIMSMCIILFSII